MMEELIAKIIMWWLHKERIKCGQPILVIKGVGKDYPKYLLFTEDEEVYKRMDNF